MILALQTDNRLSIWLQSQLSGRRHSRATTAGMIRRPRPTTKCRLETVTSSQDFHQWLQMTEHATRAQLPNSVLWTTPHKKSLKCGKRYLSSQLQWRCVITRSVRQLPSSELDDSCSRRLLAASLFLSMLHGHIIATHVEWTTRHITMHTHPAQKTLAPFTLTHTLVWRTAIQVTDLGDRRVCLRRPHHLIQGSAGHQDV